MQKQNLGNKYRLFGKKWISWAPTFSNGKLPHRSKRFGCLVAEGCRASSGRFCPDLTSTRLLSSHVGFCSSQQIPRPLTVVYSWHVCEMFGHDDLSRCQIHEQNNMKLFKVFFRIFPKKERKIHSYKRITFHCHDSHKISDFLLFGEFERQMQIKHELS